MNFSISPTLSPRTPRAHTTRQEEVVAVDDDGGNEAGIGSPQSALSGVSVVAAALDEGDKGGVS